MRADQPVAGCQGLNVGAAANQALAIVRSLENFVDEKQDRWRSPIGCGVQDGLQAFDLRIEERQTRIERVVDADAAARRLQLQVKAEAQIGAPACAKEVDADRSKKVLLPDMFEPVIN